MPITLYTDLTEKDKTEAVENLILHASPRQEYFLMIILSVLMATFGLLLNSGSVIIGSMLVAPLLYPVLGVSMGIVMVDSKLIRRSFYTILKSMGWAVLMSALIALFFSGANLQLNAEIMARTEPSLSYAAISIIAGLAASFSLISPRLNASLPGVAISVALIPPLSVVGIGVALWDWKIVSGALVLFLINIGGILSASMIVFSMLNFYIRRKVAQVMIAKDEQEIKAAVEKAVNLKQEEEQKSIKIHTQVDGEPEMQGDYVLTLDQKINQKAEKPFEVNPVGKNN